MGKSKKMRIACVILLLVGIFLCLYNTSYGAINEDYYNTIKSTLTVDDENLDSKVNSSTLLDAIGILVYAVGSLLESILGKIFFMVSGDNIFPWADAILFNAIPILDVNIFNPSNASLVSQITEFIYDSYWTVFALASTFFGIAVMVTSIKLLITTIASDKARYKQAVVKWLLGFVMLWGIHFFMSFVFYLNEKMVEVAGTMATESIGTRTISVKDLYDSKGTDVDKVNNFINIMINQPWNLKRTLTTTGAVVGAVLLGAAVIVISVGTFGVGTIVGGVAGLALLSASGISAIGTSVTKAIVSQEALATNLTMEQSKKIIQEYASISADLLNNSDYVRSLECRVEMRLQGDEGWNQPGDYVPAAVKYLAYDTIAIAEPDTIKTDQGDTYLDVLKAYIKIVDKIKADGQEIIKEQKHGKYEKNDYTIMDNRTGGSNKSCEGTKCSDMEAYITIPKMINGNKDNIINEDVLMSDAYNVDTTLYKKAKAMQTIDDKYKNGEKAGNNLIANLAQAFKDMAWTMTPTSWEPSKISVSGALLYAILVAQSLIFFIAYIKRLFYVIILALMAPIVVVYDFFNKFE